MLTTSLEDKGTHYAYRSIRDFFDHYGLSGAVADLNSILKAAVSRKAWRKGAPCNVLLFIEKLTALCAAAFTIHQSNSLRTYAILKKPENSVPDVSVLQHFAGNQIPSIWEYFPRSLTASQYHNPYKGIRKFTACMAEPAWNKLFKELTEYALSNQSVSEIYPPYNILIIHRRLLQLIEACHLLDVRTNLKDEIPPMK